MKNVQDPSISMISVFNPVTGLQDATLERGSLHAESESDYQKLAKSLLKGFNREIIYRFREGAALKKSLYEFSGNAEAFRKFSDDFIRGWMAKEIKQEIIFCLFENLPSGEGTTSGYGVFLIDERDKFLQVLPSTSGVVLKMNEGINLKKLNDAALIINGNGGNGLTIFLRRNRDGLKSDLADRFLEVEPEKNSFNNTVGHLSMLRAFVDQELEDSEPLDKIDKISRSADYFKTHDHFNHMEFGSAIFEDPEHLAAFDKFREQYSNEREILIDDDFEISPDAVKKNFNRIRSVIKLDRNFHIYVHGNRHNIIKGFDPERGKHFYQLFFDEET